MRNKNILYSFLSSLGVLIYVSGVAWFLSNGEKIFGKNQSMGIPVAFLLVFVLSAAITGSLVFGYPVWQYLDGKKKEALKALGWNLGFLAIFTIAALALIAI